MRQACLAIFFLDLEVGEGFCTWGRLEPAFGGKGRRAFDRLVSPAEGVSALALTHF